MITVNHDLQSYLLKLKSAPAIRLLLYLNENIVMNESEICVFFKKNEKTMRKIGELLEEKELIKVVRLKETKEIFYCIHKRFYSVEHCCTGCKFLNKKEIEVSDLKAVHFECAKKGKPCFYKHTLKGYNLLRYILPISEKTSFEAYNRNIGTRKDKPAAEWSYKDFANHYAVIFKLRYPNLIPPNTHELKSVTQKLMKMFKETNNSEWRRLLKQYIQRAITEAASMNRVITIWTILDKPSISSFLNTKGKKLLKRAEYCEEKQLFCSFCVAKNCTLTNGISSCTSSIIKTMQNKYN